MPDTLLLKPVFSRPASTLPARIQLPPGWQRLAWHQAETLRALDDPEVDVIVNTAMTGDGKSLAAYLGVLTRDRTTIGMYPTNELARDQEGQVRGYIQQFAPSWEPRLVRVSGPELEVYAREAEIKKGAALSSLSAQREVLLTNPDIFHYLHRGAYIYDKDSSDRLWQRIDNDFELFIFDEFHVFGPPQVAAVINTLLLLRYTMGRKKFMFLSATPDPQLIERLRLAGFNVREIDPKAADCYRSPADDTEAQALTEQGWRRVSRGLELEFIRLEPSPRASEAWLRENASRILEYFLTYPGSRGAIILNSIASVKRLLPHFQAIFIAAGLTVRENTGLTGAAGRRESLEADLVLGTSTIDVGVDFKINFLVFESSDAGNFIQRLGRLGRHDGHESANGFAPFQHFKAIALAPNFFVERLFDTPEAPFSGGGTFDRFFLNEQIRAHYRQINEFSGYYKTWGAIQSLKIAYELGHTTIKAQYAEAKVAFSDACQQVFGVALSPLFGRVKGWEREWHELSGQKGNPIFDVATSFRGAGDLQCGLYDPTETHQADRFKTYGLPGVLANLQVEAWTKAEFLAALEEAEQRSGRPIARGAFKYCLAFFRLIGYREERLNWKFVYSGDIDELLQKSTAQVVRGLEVWQPENPDIREINKRLRQEGLVCFVVERPVLEVRNRLRLPMHFQIYPLADERSLYDANAPCSIAFGQSALLLDTLSARLPSPATSWIAGG
ncbi:distinct helicase family with a unique C-terminal domain including a metal-binding cysteine cluster [Gloeobacter kilaueensis JS1]|uniref:Distinct helicase family with a unique C-terminal domain including a metal-binding cysteine cluster n=1 Tax=Gloeobacter kilaueensis (strain ATCC BAA-2537 / CCAP 1431/1 / ULC 316 / JS1) TaxID=1183438 RepID=U5QKI9_GLOK1|nr:distinct helicase family with a unique C-terminal domain including a metal-binding cysteine cluster [Gloeobacter kilaueensis JS1]